MIYVIASIELKDAKNREAFLAILNANVPKVRAEKGCVMYQPTVDFNSGFPAQKRVSDKFVTIIECWESLGHLQTHLKAPHMAEYKEKVKDLVHPTVLNVVESVG